MDQIDELGRWANENNISAPRMKRERRRGRAGVTLRADMKLFRAAVVARVGLYSAFLRVMIVEAAGLTHVLP